MKCPTCGSELKKGVSVCPKCNTRVEANAAEQVYTGKTKSKTLAGILMLFGAGDLYLLDFKKFFLRAIVVVFTLGFGVIWQLVDAIKIFSGKINCDAKGTPLV